MRDGKIEICKRLAASVIVRTCSVFMCILVIATCAYAQSGTISVTGGGTLTWTETIGQASQCGQYAGNTIQQNTFNFAYNGQQTSLAIQYLVITGTCSATPGWQGGAVEPGNSLYLLYAVGVSGGTLYVSIYSQGTTPTSATLNPFSVSASNPVTQGKNATLTGQLLYPNASGSVAFTVDGAAVGTATMSNSSASFTEATSSLSVGNHTVGATYTYSTQSFTASNTFVVQGTPTISINDIPSNAIYGGSFTVTYSYSGTGSPTESVVSNTTNVCTVSNGTVTFVGVGTCSLTPSATATTYYIAATGNPQTFTIGQATPTISISNIPSGSVFGGSYTATYTYSGNGSPTESVSSSTTNVCTASGSSVSFVGVGTCTLTPSATSTTDYTAVTGSAQSFSVGQATPTISINDIPSSPVYGGNFSVTYSYSGTGSPTESVSSNTTSVCTVSGNSVSFVGAGTCTLTPSASSTTNYIAVTGSAQSFSVGQATPTISINDIPSNAVYGGSFTVTYSYSGTGSPTESVSSNTTSVCTVSGNSVSFVGAGTCTLTPSASSTTNYIAVTGSAQSFSVAQASQTISFTAPSSETYGTAPITLTATGGASGNPVTFTVQSGPGSISGNTLSINGVGTIVVAANQAGNTNYASAPTVTQSIAVNPSSSTSSGTANPELGTVTFQQTSTTSTCGQYGTTKYTSYLFSNFVYTGPTTGPSIPTQSFSTTYTYIDIPPNTPNCPPAGWTAPNGLYLTGTEFVIYVNLSSGLPPSISTHIDTVTISPWAGSTTTYGTPLTFTATEWMTGAQGTMTFFDGGTAIPGCSNLSLAVSCTTSSLSASASGLAHSISATYNSSDGHSNESSQSVVETITQATPSLNWPAPAAISYGTALSGTQLNATSSVAGTFSYSPAAGTQLSVGSYTLNVTFTPTDTADYKTATASVQLTINQATPTITWPVPASITYGTALSAAQLDATSPVAGSFSYSPGIGAVLSAGSQMLNVTFTPTDTHSYSATSKSVSLTVNPLSTMTEISSSSSSSSYSQAITLSSLIDTGWNGPTGTVSFKDGSTVVGTGTVSPVTVTNMVPYSQQLGTSPWSGYCGTTTNMTLNTADFAAPDGSQTATKFVMPSSFSCGSGASWGELASVPGGLTAGQSYTVSAWMRGAAGGEQVTLGVDDGNGKGFTLTNTWTRYSYTVAAYSGSNPSRGFEFIGITANSTFYIWGPQMQVGGDEGPFVPTQNTPVTAYGGAASIPISSLGPGAHSITASYSGDTNDAPSNSAPISQAVSAVTPSLSLSWSPAAPILNTPTTFICTATYLERPVIDGTVLRISLDGTNVASVAASAGSGSWTSPGLSSGSHQVVCTAGDSNYNSASASGSLTVHGTYDSGTIKLTVNGTLASTATYGPLSTPETVASDLAGGQTSGSPVNLSEEDGILFLNSKTAGSGTNYAYTLQTTSWDTGDFRYASFVPGPINSVLDGGADASTQEGIVYQYTIPAYTGATPTGYDAVGNIVGFSDSAMPGTWGYSYDTLNRLSGYMYQPPGTGTAKSYNCWSYDSFGNRTAQVNNGVTTCPSTLTPTVAYNANNQITWVQNTLPNGPTYGAAGGVMWDGTNSYLYDSEGRICAVKIWPVPGVSTMMGYVYNAEGERVAKGYITNWTCDISANGFQPVSDYIIGPNGEQLTENGSDGKGNMVWSHTNVSAGGSLMASYDKDGLHFFLNDWLGNRRVQTDFTGVTEQTCTNLPFGDNLSCSGTISSPTEHHFTGKERDAESGNDYFKYRYYASSVGRWLSPDDSLDGAIMELPQTWNKYSYEYNRPLYGTDPDGRCPPCIGALVGGVVEGSWNLGSQLLKNHGDLSQVNWKTVGANALGGAVSGAIAGATGGGSLLADAFIGAGSNVAGGITTRIFDPDKNSDDVFDIGEISNDALSGFVGGGVGHVASEYVHEPQDLGPRPKNGRRRLAKYDKAASQETKLRNLALGAGIVAGSFPAHGVQGFINHFWNVLDWLVMSPENRAPKWHVTLGRICDENGNNCH